jgi:SAM-dependent methyltransferase
MPQALTMAEPEYRCPRPTCGRARLVPAADGLACPKGHFFGFAKGTDVPVFDKLAEDANEYAIGEAATKHDNAWRWVLATFGTDEPSLREALVARLELGKGDRVLVTGAGAGNDLPYLARRLMGAGAIYAQDIAEQMLLVGVQRHRDEVAQTGVAMHFSVSDATHLPFADGYFDAAYHFGGINLFSDVRLGIAEMNRVVKEGGKVVVGDEGVAPWLKDTEIGRMLVRNNAMYGWDAPLALLPETVRDPKLGWELCNTFWVIEFRASTSPLPIDIDVPHVGLRGGSIRTRYSGQLEGVDPALRERIYAEAERRGISRVQYLESLFRDALSKRDGGKAG